MKIEINSPMMDPVTSGAAHTPTSVAENSNEPVTTDTTALSTGKANIESLAAQALNSPEVRQDKVDALRQMIKAGDYKVDPQAIASAMIRESE